MLEENTWALPGNAGQIGNNILEFLFRDISEVRIFRKGYNWTPTFSSTTCKDEYIRTLSLIQTVHIDLNKARWLYRWNWTKIAVKQRPWIHLSNTGRYFFAFLSVRIHLHTVCPLLDPLNTYQCLFIWCCSCTNELTLVKCMASTLVHCPYPI